MLKKVLIANRGEIAARIVRSARKLGVGTVAVYSDADAQALHVAAADEAAHIGASPATDSYLRIDRVLEAARHTGADAVHPGYGFLSENADFAAAVTKAGLKFVGPSASAMRALGGKAEAKAIAIKAGVPVVPGYQGEQQDVRTLAAEAKRIGYPVMIKAVAGGGGRGMRLIERAADFAAALESARREAQGAFGDARVLIEKLILAPRHIEVQVFGDRHGNVVHLFERDCSLQRRHQKVIEEAPAPGMSGELRTRITDAAVKLAKAVGYEGAGTVEFLVEGGALGPVAPWYFIEMNTRLQVEHPVTEAITGLDLVEWQLRIAAGEKLPLAQHQVAMVGHAVEARLYAEDPANGFLPSTGRLAACAFPAGDGVRIDTGVRAGDEVSPYYDPMVAKLIARGPDRATAFDRLSAALSETVVAGPRTNAAFLKALIDHPDVRAERLDTGLIGRELPRLTPRGRDGLAVARGAFALLSSRADGAEPERQASPWAASDGFQLGGARAYKVALVADGEALTVDARWVGSGLEVAFQSRVATASADGSTVVDDSGRRQLVLRDLVQTAVAWPTYDVDAVGDGDTGGAVRAPINGRLAKVFVAPGDAVEKGDRIAVVEAMKMEHVLHAPRAGTIAKLGVKEGQQVTQGTLIAALAEAPG